MDCTCSKEKELGQISTDLKRAVKILEGNGQPGLITTVPELTTKINTLLKNLEAKEQSRMNGWQRASIVISSIIGISSIVTILIVKFA